ncbi:MAG: acyltransferase [Alicyclobacillus sp.]|nr:acyltransferase [Alicyclobacillus sp.]
MPAKKHLYEIDLLRACIILGVICVHGISFFDLFVKQYSPANIGYDAALTAFHFTREAFMFITGLVLFVTYYHRPFQATSFWGKRFKLIFIPYVAWTVIYILFEGTYLKHFVWSWSYVLGDIGQALLTGNQFYLYYLLISIQLYIFFPPMVWWLRRAKRWHLHIFVASFVLELFFMWLNQAVFQNMRVQGMPTWLALLIKYRDRNIITYQFWFIAGGITAIYYNQIRAFLQAHTRMVVSVLLAGLAVLWAHFVLQRLWLHDDETMSTLVLQPIMIPYSLVVAFTLLRVGIGWADHRESMRPQVVSKLIQLIAGASFGVFLVHPVVLHFVEVAIYKTHPPAGLREALLPVAILVVYAVSICVSYLIGHIPLVSYIVGQRSSLRMFMRNDVARAPSA